MGRVSIRTRSFDRVMLSLKIARQIPTVSFNPHPVFRPGDARQRGSPYDAMGVSIRTRSFDRVMRKSNENV
mgnify:CR=1 FL=1